MEMFDVDDYIHKNQSFEAKHCACGEKLTTLYEFITTEDINGNKISRFINNTIKICENNQCGMYQDRNKLGRWQELPQGYKFFEGKKDKITYGGSHKCKPVDNLNL